MYSKSDPKRFRYSTQRGFALPLTLGVLLLLSITATGILHIIDQSIQRAQLLKSSAHQQWAQYSIEQELIWIALKERNAAKSRELVNNFQQNTRPHREDIAPWNTSSRVMEFVYRPDEEASRQDYQVKVQDMIGLLDLNVPDPDYLNFVGKLLELPATSRRMMVNDLHQELLEFRNMHMIDDELFRSSAINGLGRTHDLCQIQSWSTSKMCKEPISFAHYFSFGSGLMANPRFSPDHLIQTLGLDNRSTDIDKLIGWERIQQREGFYSPLQSNRGGGSDFHIWMRSTSTDHVVFFRLRLNNSDGQTPYSIVEREEHSVPFNAQNLFNGQD